MGYCCHVLAGVLDYYLDMLEKFQKQVHCATGAMFADSLTLQKKHCNVISIGQFYRNSFIGPSFEPVD